MRTRFWLLVGLITLFWGGAVVAGGTRQGVVWGGDATPTPTDVSDDPRVNEYFRDAEQLLCLGDYAAAIDVYTQALEVDPTLGLAYSFRLFAYFAADLPDPVAHLRFEAQTARRMAPNDGETFLLSGAILAYDEEYTAAIRALTRAIELLPPDRMSNGYEARAYAYNQMEEFDLALSDYEEALRLNPDDNGIRVNRTDVYLDMGDAALALDYAQEAYDYMLANDITNACAYVQLANAEVMALRGEVYLELGENAAAIADYTAALALDITNLDAYVGRGQAYWNLDQPEAALADFLDLLEYGPDYPAGYYMVSALYIEAEDYTAALDYANQCITGFPDDAYCYLIRGLANWGDQNSRAAIADLTQAIALDGALADAYYYRGLYHYRLTNWADALADFRTYQELLGDKVDPQVRELIKDLEQMLER